MSAVTTSTLGLPHPRWPAHFPFPCWSTRGVSLHPLFDLMMVFGEPQKSRTRIVVVSGRPAKHVRRSLGLDQIEVSGCHGAERLLASGRLVTCPDEAVREHLERVLRAMTYEGLDERY